tara:strand:- start:2820 stop:3254 length:435 start_codon:yes stop_codon:yes gene_type:complete
MMGALCLALTIYHEARGEPIFGQRLVAEVVMNRVASEKYPNDICQVVTQKKQFSYIGRGNKLTMPDDPISWYRATKVANRAINNYLDGLSFSSDTQMMYYHTKYVNPYWSETMRKTHSIGKHLFFSLRPTAIAQSIRPKRRVIQ